MRSTPKQGALRPPRQRAVRSERLDQQRRIQERQDKLFDDELAHLRAAWMSNVEHLDSLVLSTSVGLVAFSAAFMNRTVAGALLKWSWGLFGAAIILTLGSYVTGARSARIGISDAQGRVYGEALPGAERACSNLRLVTEWLGGFSAVAFVVALLLTVIVSTANVH